MKLSYYDFEKLKARFPFLQESEVLHEYASVCNSIQDAFDSYSSGRLSWDDLSSSLDDTLTAQDYLAGYLAGLYLQTQGYEHTDDNRWLLSGT